MNTPHHQPIKTKPSGFSLLELIVAVTVMSIIAVVIMPIITTSTDAYAAARDTRAGTDRVVYALERTARVVRQTPFAADESGLDLQTVSPTQYILTDGSGFRLNGTDLELLKPGGDAFILCTDIQKLAIAYFDQAGMPITPADLTLIHRVNLQIYTGTIMLDMYALPRSWIGRGS